MSLTCDGWQASKTDAYFAVMAHLIEVEGDKAINKSILIGITCLNNAHHGVRLGQALFKVAHRVNIVKKVYY